MTKANITLPNGTTIQIEGTKNEIKELLEFYSTMEIKQQPKTSARRKKSTSSSGGNRKTATGPTTLIRDLKEEGFFKSKRKLGDIQKKLEEKGFIYATTSLSPALTKLTRGKILRRISEKGGWKYVSN